MQKLIQGIVDFDILGKIARALASVHILASEEAEETREITGEDILAACEAAGGTAEVIRDPDSKVILEIKVSVETKFDAEALMEKVGGILAELSAAAAPKKLLGDLAQTSVGMTPVNFTGNTTSGSAIVTGLAGTSGLSVGQTVTGTGITAGSTILSFGSNSSLTLSANCTATGAGVALTATGEMQVIGLAEWTISWKRKSADATTTDDSTYESSLASTASWDVKAKYMFVDGDVSQSEAVLAAINSPQAAVPWNFFPTVEAGRSAFTGNAYIDGITLASGMGKVVGLDVSLKGTGPLKTVTQATSVANANTATGVQAEV